MRLFYDDDAMETPLKTETITVTRTSDLYGRYEISAVESGKSADDLDPVIESHGVRSNPHHIVEPLF